MKEIGGRQIPFWRIGFVLLLSYAMYIFHFFLTIGELHGGPFGGPAKVWEVITLYGMCCAFGPLIYGDVPFWLASVQFARRQFSSAVGAGIFALAFSFICLIGPYLGYFLYVDPNAGGNYWEVYWEGILALALRMISMSLVVGFAWRYSSITKTLPAVDDSSLA